jgi:hypothetical protein
MSMHKRSTFIKKGASVYSQPEIARGLILLVNQFPGAHVAFLDDLNKAHSYQDRITH